MQKEEIKLARMGWIIFLSSFFSLSAFAQIDIHLTDTVNQRIFPLSELYFFEDSTNQLSFDEIKEVNFQPNFQKKPNYRQKDFNPHSSYWVKVTILPDSISSRIWMLEFYDQTLDEITAFLPQPGKNYESRLMGDALPFKRRQFQHKNFEIIVPNHVSAPLTYYFKVKSHDVADIRIVVRSLNQFVYYALNEYFLFGIFHGMVLIITLYNLLMFFAIQERKYLIYIFYLISVGLYAMSSDGLGYQYLWPNHPEWNQIAVGVTIYSTVLWALLFTKSFLNTKINNPFLGKLISMIIILRTVLFLTGYFFNQHLFNYLFLEIPSVGLMLYTSIAVLMKGYQPARYVVIGYGFLFMGFTIKSLVDVGLFPFTIISHYSLRFCFLLEMLFLTFALGDKIHILKDMRDRAQRRIIREHELNVALGEKVNKELEQKVNERTTEIAHKNQLLEESNQKLIDQSREIDQINSMLDLENWKLKNSIKEIMQDRFVNKDLTYEDFTKIFPNTTSCYVYLESLKWKSGYHCKKCNNDKYFEGAKKFSRRCTRCGYDESVTAFTVFHRIKFPIKKAFYLLYLTTNQEKDFTLNELAEILDLRKNTVWSFKNKVKKALESDTKPHKPHLSEQTFQRIFIENLPFD